MNTIPAKQVVGVPPGAPTGVESWGTSRVKARDKRGHVPPTESDQGKREKALVSQSVRPYFEVEGKVTNTKYG